MYPKMWILQMIIGASNLLVANMYWMESFKILVFDASLFEKTPNRNNSEIEKSFLSLMFSPMFYSPIHHLWTWYMRDGRYDNEKPPIHKLIYRMPVQFSSLNIHCSSFHVKN